MNRLIEDWFPKKYQTKWAAFSSFIPIHLAAHYLNIADYKLYEEIMTSPFLHGVDFNGKISLHPEEVLNRLTKAALKIAKKELKNSLPSLKRSSLN